MTQAPPSTPTTDHTSPESGRTLADRLQGGEEFAVTFGGQGTDWFATLAELLEEEPDAAKLAELVEASGRRLEPVAGEVAAALPRPFEPQQWLAAEERPAAAELTNAALGLPGVLLTQLTTLDLLAAEGLDLAKISPVAAVGHSQGILGVAAFAGRREQAGDSDVELLAIARLIGAAATIAARRARLVPHGEDSPMLAVSGATPAEVAVLAEAASEGDDLATLAVVNGPRHTVVSGSPDALRRFRAAVEKRAAAEAAEIEAKTRGGRAFDPTLESIPVAIGFHHPSMAPAVAMVRTWAEACGLDAGLAEHLAHAICVETVDWPRELTDAVGGETRFVVDLGPADLSANLTGRALRGRGITVIPAATEKGRDVLFTAGAEVRTAADWSAHAPRLIDRGPRVGTARPSSTPPSPG